jgi:hypothetical protein
MCESEEVRHIYRKGFCDECQVWGEKSRLTPKTTQLKERSGEQWGDEDYEEGGERVL